MDFQGSENAGDFLGLDLEFTEAAPASEPAPERSSANPSAGLATTTVATSLSIAPPIFATTTLFVYAIPEKAMAVFNQCYFPPCY